MRSGPSDYGRSAGGWWLLHGIAEAEPDGHGGVRAGYVRRDETGKVLNQVYPRQSEDLAVTWGIVQDGFLRYPDPDALQVPEGWQLYLSILAELPDGRISPQKMNALLRQVDAAWDKWDAEEGYGA